MKYIYIYSNIQFYLVLIFFIIILQSRLKMISKLPESIQQSVAKLNSSLNGKVGHTHVQIMCVIKRDTSWLLFKIL